MTCALLYNKIDLCQRLINLKKKGPVGHLSKTEF